MTPDPPPAPPDDDHSVRSLVLDAIAVPVGLLLLVPLVLLFAAWFYLSACVQAVRLVMRSTLRRKPSHPAVHPLPGPHFREAGSGVPTEHEPREG